jgi:gliding motility-associated-like protein
VNQGFGETGYWGPESPEYVFVSPNSPATILDLNSWETDHRLYNIYWYQKNGTCDPDSVSMTVELYQQPGPASVQSIDSTVYFRQSVPLWADSVEIGTGSWKDWDWIAVGGADPVSDINNHNAVTVLGSSDNLQEPWEGTLYWKVSNGVCDPDSVEVRINRKDLVTYSAFSPNGDGRNDYLILDGLEHADKFSMRIFSRHGRLVKTITEADVFADLNYGDEENIVWDGKMENGSDAADGTYFYLIEVIHAGQTYNYKNYLELVRTETIR